MTISKIFLHGVCLLLCALFINVTGAFAYDEFIVNDPVADADADHASSAVNKHGDIFVVWNEQQLNLPYVVKGKVIYGATGKSSPIITISEPGSPTSNLAPSVASDGKGLFVVAWTSRHPSGNFQVKARLYGRYAFAFGDEFVVNDEYLKNGAPAPAPWPNPQAIQDWPSKKTFLYANFPSVAMNASGRFVVVWDQWDGQQQNRYIRLFNKWAKAKSPSVQLNAFGTTLAYSGLPDVDVNDQGDIIVAWSEDYLGTSAIAYRQFNLSDSSLVGDESLIFLPSASYHQVRPMASINASGDALISWSEIPADGSPTSVYASKYEAATGLWSAPFSPVQYLNNANRIVGKLLSTGELILGYSPYVSGTKDIVLETFSNALMPQKTKIVNQTQAGVQVRAAFALLEASYNWLVVTWESDQNGSRNVYCRLYRLDLL